MNTNELDQLRRVVREAVFRAGRLRRDGRGSAADESLASELITAQAGLASGGTPDAASLVHQWRRDDEAAFALAVLISELVGERLHASPTPHRKLTVEQPELPPLPATSPTVAPPPGLADLLDGLFTEERPAKRGAP
ncbi:MAG: hypothetical protein IPL39_21575 [Opitutaceae bacterium]|nr:hypothetical protein [Opitutaceae bacterium]